MIIFGLKDGSGPTGERRRGGGGGVGVERRGKGRKLLQAVIST